MVNYGKQYSYGYMAHTESTKDFVNLVAAFQPSQKQSVNLYVGYSNSYDQRGGELTIDQYNNGDYSGNPAYIKNNAHSKLVGFRAGISHQYNFSSQWSNTTTVFGSGFNGNASSAGGWTDKSPINYGLRSVINTNYKFNDGMALTGITGIETQHQYNPLVSYRMTANPSDPDGYNVIGNLKGNKMITTGTTALFTQWSLALPSDWLLTAGLGLSDMKIQLEDRMYDSNSTNPTVYKSKYIGLVSPHVAINKILSDKVSIYASYSKGYKAPVSSYFYIPYTGEVNKDLKSEIGNQFEIGSKGNLFEDRLSYQLALYHVKFSNKMTAVAVPVEGDPSATAYSYMVNGGSQVHKGLETQLKYKLYNSNTNFIKALSPFANLTYTDFKYKNFGIQKSATVFEDYSRNAVAGVARLTTNLGLDIITKHGVYASATYSYKDGVPITSDGKFRAHSFALLNAKVGINHIISNHWVLDASFGLNNITSTHYYYMVFVNQLPDAYLPAPNKINYFGGISLKYNL
jgi:iron complex outermembrane receptor protein